MSMLDELNKKIEFLENALDNDLLDDPDFDMGEFEDVVCDMEIDFADEGRYWSEEEQAKVDEILRLIKKVKADYDFFDADAERGFMFPDGEDDDF